MRTRATWATPNEMFNELVGRLRQSKQPFNATVPGSFREGIEHKHDAWMFEVWEGGQYSCLALAPGPYLLLKSRSVAHREWLDLTYQLPELALSPGFRGAFESFVANGSRYDIHMDFTDLEELKHNMSLSQFDSGKSDDAQA